MALDTGDSIPESVQAQLHMQKDTLYAVDFFASWCKSCKKELPLISKAYQAGNTHIIGVNVDKNKQAGQAYVAKLKLPFPITYDTDQTLIKLFKPMGFPTLYYIKNGKIVKSIVGAVDQIDRHIQADMKAL